MNRDASPADSVAVTRLTDDSLEGDVRRATGPVLIGAYSPGCAQSVAMADVFQRLAWSFTRLVRFCLLNAQTSPGAAFQLGIQRTPSVVFVIDGVTTAQATCYSEACLRSLTGVRTDWTHQLPQSALVLVSSKPAHQAIDFRGPYPSI